MTNSKNQQHPDTLCYHCHRTLPEGFRVQPWNKNRQLGPFFDTQKCRDLEIKRHAATPIYEPVPAKSDNDYSDTFRQRAIWRNEDLEKQALRNARDALVDEYRRFVAGFEATQHQQDTEQQALLAQRPIPEHIRFEHTHILGPAGSGKTTLIQQIVLDDLAKPSPPAYVIIDPKGELIRRISRLEQFHPEHGALRDRLLIIQPTERPALEMFDFGSLASFGEHEREAITTQLIETFAYIFSSSDAAISQRQSVPFSFVIRLVVMMGGNIETLMDVLEDNPKDKKFARQIADLSAVNPGARRFFATEFYSDAFKPTREQIRTRLYEIIARPLLMHMFTAGQNKLDIFKCMQERKIVLVNTDRNLLGAKGSQLLGRYIIAKVLNAAFSRQFLPKEEWHAAFLMIDEFQDYADDDKIPDLLRLAREYRLGVSLAHQVMHSRELSASLQTNISTNTSIKYCSSPEAIDQNYMARDLRCEADFFKTHTAPGHFACFVRGMSPPLQHPFLINLQFPNITDDMQMDDFEYGILLERNRAMLAASKTHNAPEGAFREFAATPATSDKPIVPSAPPKAESVGTASDPHTGDHTRPATNWGDE
jgi:hypothetical protein